MISYGILKYIHINSPVKCSLTYWLNNSNLLSFTFIHYKCNLNTFNSWTRMGNKNCCIILHIAAITVFIAILYVHIHNSYTAFIFVVLNFCLKLSILLRYNTVCLRSSDPFHIIGYFIKWVSTSRHIVVQHSRQEGVKKGASFYHTEYCINKWC